MNEKTEKLFMERLREIMEPSELDTFIGTPDFLAASEAAENGWPFTFRRIGDKLELTIRRSNASV